MLRTADLEDAGTTLWDGVVGIASKKLQPQGLKEVESEVDFRRRPQ
jgi:hypothetical protein